MTITNKIAELKEKKDKDKVFKDNVDTEINKISSIADVKKFFKKWYVIDEKD